MNNDKITFKINQIKQVKCDVLNILQTCLVSVGTKHWSQSTKSNILLSPPRGVDMNKRCK